MTATAPRDRTKTVQDVGTPLELIAAVEQSVGGIWVDLASTQELAVCKTFVTPEMDALGQKYGNWAAALSQPGRWGWLNPPFGESTRWVKHAAEQAFKGARLILLLQAAVGSNYFAEHIYGRAEVRFLQGRLTFRGHAQPYPKDCLLAIYEPGRYPALRVWDWRKGKLR